MCKKIVAVTLGAILAVYVLSHTRVGSYATTAFKQLREDAGNQVSVEFEIQRLKNEVAKLDPDININRKSVAQEKVALDTLHEEVQGLQTKLDEHKGEIRRVSAELKNGARSVSFSGQEYTATQATDKLDSMVDSAERFERTVASKKRTLDARERMYEASKKNLLAMRDEKAKLEEQIAELEATYREVQLQQTQSKHQFDCTRLAEIKKSLEGLKTRIKVEKTELELAGELGVSKPSTPEEKAKNNAEVLRRADRLLNGETSKLAEK